MLAEVTAWTPISMHAFYQQVFAQSPVLHCEIWQRIRVGKYVIDEEAITGLHLDGFPTEVHGAAVYRVEDGRIAPGRRDVQAFDVSRSGV